MTKKEFLNELAKGIAGIPDEDITRSLEFYSEMIDDRMEEGKSEEEAVAEIGTVKDAVSQILAEIPITKLIKEKVKKKRKLGTLEIVLLILGAPIWLSLLVAAFAGILSVYISVWAVIISLWAVFASLGACTLGGIAAGVIFVCTDNLFSGLAMLAASLILAGFTIFCFFGCKIATKSILILTKKIVVAIKNLFVVKEETK